MWNRRNVLSAKKVFHMDGTVAPRSVRAIQFCSYVTLCFNDYWILLTPINESIHTMFKLFWVATSLPYDKDYLENTYCYSKRWNFTGKTNTLPWRHPKTYSLHRYLSLISNKRYIKSWCHPLPLNVLRKSNPIIPAYIQY